MAALNSNIISCWLSVNYISHQNNEQRRKGTRVRTDHQLPEAGSPWVLRDSEIGLQAHLTGQRRLNLTGLRTVSGEGCALEQDLEEHLRVERAHGGVEGRAWDSGVDDVCCSDGVGREQSNGLGGGKASVAEALENLGDAVSRLRDGKIGSRRERWGAAKEEAQPRCTGAVGSSDCGSEVDAEFGSSVVRKHSGTPIDETYKSPAVRFSPSNTGNWRATMSSILSYFRSNN